MIMHVCVFFLFVGGGGGGNDFPARTLPNFREPQLPTIALIMRRPPAFLPWKLFFVFLTPGHRQLLFFRGVSLLCVAGGGGGGGSDVGAATLTC